jgi:hypothetical protein
MREGPRKRKGRVTPHHTSSRKTRSHICNSKPAPCGDTIEFDLLAQEPRVESGAGQFADFGDKKHGQAGFLLHFYCTSL